jgi:hypothetical protein
MKKNISLSLLMLGTLFITGCSNKVATYSVSTENIMSLKALSKGINLGQFTDSNRNENEIMCRLVSPVGTASGETFISYIKKAFEKELVISNKYDTTSNRKIGMNLDKIYGSTTLGNAYWEFKTTVNGSNGKSFNVNSKYDYESSYGGDSACSEMQRSFVPAVQKLIGQVIQHNEFKTLLK